MSKGTYQLIVLGFSFIGGVAAVVAPDYYRQQGRAEAWEVTERILDKQEADIATLQWEKKLAIRLATKRKKERDSVRKLLRKSEEREHNLTNDNQLLKRTNRKLLADTTRMAREIRQKRDSLAVLRTEQQDSTQRLQSLRQRTRAHQEHIISQDQTIDSLRQKQEEAAPVLRQWTELKQRAKVSRFIGGVLTLLNLAWILWRWLLPRRPRNRKDQQPPNPYEGKSAPAPDTAASNLKLTAEMFLNRPSRYRLKPRIPRFL